MIPIEGSQVIFKTANGKILAGLFVKDRFYEVTVNRVSSHYTVYFVTQWVYAEAAFNALQNAQRHPATWLYKVFGRDQDKKPVILELNAKDEAEALRDAKNNRPDCFFSDAFKQSSYEIKTEV